MSDWVILEQKQNDAEKLFASDPVARRPAVSNSLSNPPNRRLSGKNVTLGQSPLTPRDDQSGSFSKLGFQSLPTTPLTPHNPSLLQESTPNANPRRISESSFGSQGTASSDGLTEGSTGSIRVCSSHQYSQRLLQAWNVVKETRTKTCAQSHIYHHSWETVINAYQRRFPRSRKLPHMLRSTLIEHKADERGRTVFALREIMVDLQAPSWLHTMLAQKTGVFIHECSYDYDSQKMTIICSNLSFSNYAHLFERCTYRIHPDNPNWTIFEQTGYMKLPSLPLVSSVENVVFSTYEKHAKNGRVIDEELIRETTSETSLSERPQSTREALLTQQSDALINSPLSTRATDKGLVVSETSDESTIDSDPNQQNFISSHAWLFDVLRIAPIIRSIDGLFQILSKYFDVHVDIFYQMSLLLSLLLIILAFFDMYAFVTLSASIILMVTPIVWAFSEYNEPSTGTNTPIDSRRQIDSDQSNQTDNCMLLNVSDSSKPEGASFAQSSTNTSESTAKDLNPTLSQTQSSIASSVPTSSESKYASTPNQDSRPKSRHGRTHSSSAYLSPHEPLPSAGVVVDSSDLMNIGQTLESGASHTDHTDQSSEFTDTAVDSEYSTYSTPCVSVAKIEVSSIIDITRDGKGCFLFVIITEGNRFHSRDSRADMMPVDASMSMNEFDESSVSMNIVSIDELIAFDHSCEDIWKTFRSKSSSRNEAMAVSRINLTDIGYFKDNPNASYQDLQEYYSMISSCDHAIKTIESHLRATLQDPAMARNRLTEIFLNIGLLATFNNDDPNKVMLLASDFPSTVKHSRIIRICWRTCWKEEILLLTLESLISVDIRTKEVMVKIPLQQINSVVTNTTDSGVAGWVFLEVRTVKQTLYFCSTDKEAVSEWAKSIMNQIHEKFKKHASSVPPDHIYLRASIEENQRHSKQIVLNRHKILWNRVEARPAEIVVEDLLSLAITLYDEARQDNSDFATNEAFAYRFYSFEKSTSELQIVTLAEMNESSLLAFYMNLYHLILIHALIIVGAPSSTSTMKNFLKRTTYEVDGLIVSPSDIESIVLNTVMSRPNVMGKLLSRRISELVPHPTKYKSVIPSLRPVNPLLSLALHRGHISSFPHVTIFRSEALAEQIREIGVNYLRMNTNLVDAKGKLHLPKLFEWIFEEYEMRPPVALDLVMDLLDEQRKAQVAELMKQGGPYAVKIRYEDYNWGYYPSLVYRKAND